MSRGGGNPPGVSRRGAPCRSHGGPSSWTSGPSVQGVATRATRPRRPTWASTAHTGEGSALHPAPSVRGTLPHSLNAGPAPASGRAGAPHPAVLAPSCLPGARMSIWGIPVLDSAQSSRRCQTRAVFELIDSVSINVLNSKLTSVSRSGTHEPARRIPASQHHRPEH
jgi:hypothetical protein